MSSLDTLGFVAAFCTTVSFLPQALKVIKTGDTAALSLIMYATFTFGVFLWLCYGIFRDDPAIIVANFVTFCLACVILFLKIRNDVWKARLNR